MAKKITLNDILTKISYVFKKDCYIINRKYVIGGEESEYENASNMLCLLTPESSQEIELIFPEDNTIYISDVKKYKKDLEKNVSTKIFDSERNELLKRVKEIEEKTRNIENWKSFNFSDEELLEVFKEGGTKELFIDDEDIPSVPISKSLFPMASDKNANTIYYSLSLPKDEKDLAYLITSFDTPYFQLYNIISYLPL